MNDHVHDEALRVINICNACRYCEGHCAVFPAISRQLEFNRNDVEHLAHLCHQCGACYQHCQYAAPHEFNVNVPLALTDLRETSYPASAGPFFTDLTIAISIALFAAIVVFNGGATALVAPTTNFYALIPHTVMAAVFTFAACGVLIAWAVIARRYWQRIRTARLSLADCLAALREAVLLRHLGGGHEKGCYELGERPSLWRRRFHHLTLVGFLLCFLATTTGTVYHFALNLPAPYGLVSLPKLFGMTGGVLLAAGSAGLLINGRRQVPVTDVTGTGESLSMLLLLTSLTGLALPFVATGKGVLLAAHLGIVLALFINFALGHFLHGLFRYLSLVRDQAEK